MTAIFTESEYEIELSAVQGPAGAGVSAIANNTLLGNTSGSTATPVARTAQQMGLLSATEVQTYTTEQQEVARENIDLDWLKRNTNISLTSINREGPEPTGTSGNLVIIGSLAVNGDGGSITGLTDSLFAGTQSGRLARRGNGNVAVGNLTLAEIVETQNNVAIGDACGRKLKGTTPTDSFGNTFIGYVNSTETEDSEQTVSIGNYASAFSKSIFRGVLIGSYAGAFDETAVGTSGEHLGDYPIGIGYAAMRFAKGDDVIGIGREACFSAAGNRIVGIGYYAGKSVTSPSATDCVFIGSESGTSTGFQKTDAVNVTCIGAGTASDTDNTVVIGNTSVTRAYIRGNLYCGSINITAGWQGTDYPTNGGLYLYSNILAMIAGNSGLEFWNGSGGVLHARFESTGAVRFYNGGFTISNLPTSNPGGSGVLWNDGGTVKVT